MKAERWIVFVLGLCLGIGGGRAARIFWESTRADAAVERNDVGFLGTTLKVETDAARGYHCYWITSHPQSSPSCVAIRHDLPARATTPPQGIPRGLKQ